MKSFLLPFRRRVLAAIVVTAALCASQGELQAQKFLLDFGAAANPTFNGAAPDNDPLNFWNNVPESIGTTNTGQLSDLVSTTNVASIFDLTMIARFNGSNLNGRTDSTLYPANATRDSLYGNTEAFNNLSNIFPSFKFTSLDLTKTYNLTFYASRAAGATDNRETLYSISGGRSGSVALNPTDNQNTSVTYTGMTPSAAGEITISLTPGPNNVNANHFTYLGVLELTAVAVPEPSAAMMLLVGTGIIGLARRRSVTAA